MALAARLAAWLTVRGVAGEVATLSDLLPDLPEGCKDLADVAQRLKGSRHE
jgi:hypothetical protein